MPKKGHTEEQIIAALKQHEAGDETADVCRKLGISQAMIQSCIIPCAENGGRPLVILIELTGLTTTQLRS